MSSDLIPLAFIWFIVALGISSSRKPFDFFDRAVLCLGLAGWPLWTAWVLISFFTNASPFHDWIGVVGAVVAPMALWSGIVVSTWKRLVPSKAREN